MGERVACVGTRNLSYEQAGKLSQIGSFLVRKSNTIVSGNAEGADHAFAHGGNSINPGRVVLHLPWRGFRQEHIDRGNHVFDKPSPAGFEVSEEVWKVTREKTYGFTNWENLAPSTKNLMARNADIIMDADWVLAVPGFDGRGKPKGGTGFALALADALERPYQIIDLRRYADPAWDICDKCELGRTFWNCGNHFHSLKAYA